MLVSAREFGGYFCLVVHRQKAACVEVMCDLAPTLAGAAELEARTEHGYRRGRLQRIDRIFE